VCEKTARGWSNERRNQTATRLLSGFLTKSDVKPAEERRDRGAGNCAIGDIPSIGQGLRHRNVEQMAAIATDRGHRRNFTPPRAFSDRRFLTGKRHGICDLLSRRGKVDVVRHTTLG
jgi:hypothetical protein